MSKLITPTQYESALDELNVVRPLQLDKTVRRIIDIPAANRISVEGKKSVAGQFVKSTQQGAGIINRVNDFTQYEKLLYKYTLFQPYVSVVFSQRIYKLIIDISYIAAITYLRWVCDDGIKLIQDFRLIDTYNVDFVGNSLVLVYAGMMNPYISFDLYGFY